MTALLKGVLVAIVWSLLSGNALAGTQVGDQGGKLSLRDPRLTVLYDAFGKTNEMQKDWGYSALIEYGGRRIL